MSHVIDGLINLPPWLVLALAFALPAAEASLFLGVVVPGEVAVIVAGVLAHSHRLPLWAVIVTATAGAVLGDSIGYEVGRRYGDRLLKKLPHRLVKPDHVDRARALLRRRGGWAVLIGRFTAALRALVPGMAGTSQLPYRTFLPFNVVGGLAWVTMASLIGYAAGASYQSAEHRLSLVSGGLLAVIVLALVYRAARRSERLRGWAARRLGWVPRPGRALTVSLLVLAASGSIFGALLDGVARSHGAIGADPRLLHDVVDQRAGWLTPVARVVTNLGVGPFVYAVVIALGAALWWRTRELLLPIGAVGLLWAGQAVRVAINHAVARPRPPRALWLVQPGGYAFPSGHTAMATIGYGLAAVLLLRILSGRRSRVAAVAAGALATVLAIAVGLSRVYLGVHWPSDVAGGWSFGVAWLALAASVVCLYQRWSTKPPDPAADPGPPVTTEESSEHAEPAESEEHAEPVRSEKSD
ncbi:bifunctional DedA family/phosphatase PAP2 family protein [Pseudofrankia asymbiotica]|uniref:Phosphoesterase PA-phosphatase n=1 Tax=Pseudofrankia asymbiotica TaxID=1834516 RepID=A0A1V2I4P7_9ACTN|nr:bifunctional DedA family/phosphatase PAP2 family protein [Pseudofrankia asymbiotica]ONH25866.1 phosphoesterase PA-phosphatase [Pseudofrankia asymbiotica]